MSYGWTIALRACGIWLLIAVFAVLNGALREFIVTPYLGESLALPLSGIVLSMVIVVITRLSLDWMVANRQRSPVAIAIGVLWLIMTLLFEWIFAHVIAGKALQEMVEMFNPSDGNLFSLVLLVTVLSPYCVNLWQQRS